jgi:hypothetical protein
MLIKTDTGETKHIEAAPRILRVPSKRQAERAFEWIIERIPVDRLDWLREDIEIVRDFIRSR